MNLTNFIYRNLMNYFKRIAIFFISLVISLSVFGQQKNIGGWLGYFGNQSFKTKWNIHNEFQYRKSNPSSINNTFIFRTGLGLNLSENNNNVLLGYGFIQSSLAINETEKKINNEHRVFQQFITKNKINKFYLMHRLRLEERFFSDDFQLRFRYFLSMNIPLNKSELNQNTIYISLYNELFLNAQNNVFDQNRAFGGLGYFINKHLKSELGVLNQLTRNQNLYILQFSLFNNIPF
ncbi:MAG: hypothetical protein KFKLKKLM_00288 [Flavobacteriales bacterium]|nr:hypothetical protein [Flavobacteriales bacterium]